MIINKYLDKVGSGNFDDIAKAENVSHKEVLEAVELIQSLNPIPANGFKVDTKTIYMVPDCYVLREENGEFLIEMNSGTDEKLVINKENLDLYKKSKFQKDEKAFLEKKLNDFRWLKYSAEKRQETIRKIITFLVQYQIEYFKTGNPKVLKPIRYIDIADQVDLHVSTISRAVTNKFFSCDYGVFSFRYLIPKSYKRQDNDLVSIDILKGEIKEIIAFEDKEHPLSDEKIHMLLEEEGFSVSRRSITLYRNECSIPSSKNRKIMYAKNKK